MDNALYDHIPQEHDLCTLGDGPANPYVACDEKPEGVGVYTMSDTGHVARCGEGMSSVVLPSYPRAFRAQHMGRVFLAVFDTPENSARARTLAEADALARERFGHVYEVRTRATDPYLPENLVVYLREPEHVGRYMYAPEGRFAFAVFDRGGLLAVRLGA